MSVIAEIYFDKKKKKEISNNYDIGLGFLPYI